MRGSSRESSTSRMGIFSVMDGAVGRKTQDMYAYRCTEQMDQRVGGSAYFWLKAFGVSGSGSISIDV